MRVENTTAGLKIQDVQDFISRCGYFSCMWYEVAEFNEVDVTNKRGIESINRILAENNLDCLPKIRNGVVANREKDLSASRMVIYNKSLPLDKSSDGVKYAILVAKIAAIAARVDGVVTSDEIEAIRSSIYSLNCINQTEKYNIFVYSVYCFELFLNRWDILNDFEGLSSKDKNRMMDVVKKVVISDSSVAKQERFLLYDLYRMAGCPTNAVSKDLKVLAKECGINLTRKNNLEKLELLENFPVEHDELMMDLLSEFEVFDEP